MNGFFDLCGRKPFKLLKVYKIYNCHGSYQIGLCSLTLPLRQNSWIEVGVVPGAAACLVEGSQECFVSPQQRTELVSHIFTQKIPDMQAPTQFCLRLPPPIAKVIIKWCVERSNVYVFPCISGVAMRRIAIVKSSQTGRQSSQDKVWFDILVFSVWCVWLCMLCMLHFCWPRNNNCCINNSSSFAGACLLSYVLWFVCFVVVASACHTW